MWRELLTNCRVLVGCCIGILFALDWPFQTIEIGIQHISERSHTDHMPSPPPKRKPSLRPPTSPLRLSLSNPSPSSSSPHPEIPRLEDYDIHPLHGFLRADPPPLTRLPSYFEPWEKVLDDLNGYLLAGRLRAVVNALPLLATEVLASQREWERAYLVLSFIGQAYVWGKNEEVAEV